MSIQANPQRLWLAQGVGTPAAMEVFSGNSLHFTLLIKAADTSVFKLITLAQDAHKQFIPIDVQDIDAAAVTASIALTGEAFGSFSLARNVNAQKLQFKLVVTTGTVDASVVLGGN